MFLETDAVSGFSQFISAYERYVRSTEKRNEKPISILAFLLEMLQ